MDFVSKTPLLKTIYTTVTGLGKLSLVLTWRLPPGRPAFMVLQDARQVTKRERQQQACLNYKNSLFGKMPGAHRCTSDLSVLSGEGDNYLIKFKGA